MKLLVSKDELQKKLQKIQSVTEKSSATPVLSHLLLSFKNGNAFLTATDLMITINETLSSSVSDHGDICIPAKKLLEIVKEMDEDITLTSEKKGWLKITSGKSNFKVACLETKDFPSLPEVDSQTEFDIKADDLTDMIEKTIFSAGESDTRHTLNGLLMHIKPGKQELTIVGCDGSRLSLITKSHELKEGDDLKVILPRKAATELKKLLEKEKNVHCSIGSKTILFETEGINLYARMVEGTYPDYEKVVPSGNDKTVVVECSPFIKAVRKASVMSKDHNNAVVLDVSEKTMTVSSSDPNLGEASDEISVEYNDSALKIGFNSKFLIDGVSAFKTEKASISLIDPLSPVLITDNGNTNHLCVVMPFRL